ncbi:MAG: pilus assembly protein [Gammaproteobacteria bacterium]
MRKVPRPIIQLTGLGSAVVVGVLFAAASFVPTQQPYGWVAPATVTSSNVSSGQEVSFAPTFETTTWGGDIVAQGVTTTGQLSGTVLWKASAVLPAPDSRYIFTTDGAGAVVPFRTTPAPAGLSPTQLASFWSPGAVDYLRGVRTGEGAAYRKRTSLIGDIIHSNPAYVGKARAGYIFDGYPSFAAAQASRPGRVYVGANDGMVHAFDATTGVETFAFIPTKLIDSVDETARTTYTHRYYVDGMLTSEDAYISKGSMQWRTLLVGGLGAGGRTIFALDVTSAAPIASEGPAGAGSRYLWEFTDSSSGAANLGYTYGRPSIVRLNTGQWAVVVGNGYLSAAGKASLFLLNASDGSVIKEIVVNSASGGTNNGLSSPSLIDTNGDLKVDYAYAGDLNGNLWKFDLSSPISGNWDVAYGVNKDQPLFRTHADASAVRAPITTAPDVGVHPEGGVLVYVGTGRLFASAESTDLSTNYVYGIWDKPNLPNSSVPVATSSLLPQTLYKAVHQNGSNVRVASNNQPNWNTALGWYMPLLVDAPSAADQGERVLQDIVLRDARVQFISNNPSVPKGENWFIQLDAITGGAPDRTILDITNDLALSVADNVDRLAGTVEDVPEDRVVARYAGFGLASRPTVVSVGAQGDTAVLNTIYIVDPVPPPPADPADPGVLGGHFDLDTSSIWYDFNKGITDKHVHEWDDKTGLTEINLGADGSQIPGDPGFREIKQNITGSKKFIIVVGNAPYSWDGVLSSNGTPTKVVEYDKMQRKHFIDGPAALQKLTVYSFNPTAADLAAGVVQMTDLRLTFSPYAILKGGIIPTQTGCVRRNTPGAQQEYRNGALIVQAVDATSWDGTFSYNSASKVYTIGPVGAVGAVKADVSASKNVVYATKGLLWETSVFWHWTGPCYGAAGYNTAYKAVTGIDFNTLVDAQGDGTKGTDAGTPGDPGVGTPGVAVQQVVATRQAGTRRTGRLYWHEEVLDR